MQSGSTRLLHAVSQHLIGCDEHDADDEGHGESADETLPHARLTVLLRRVDWNEKKTKKRDGKIRVHKNTRSSA